APGELHIGLSSSGAIAATTGGSLVTVDFHVANTATLGSTIAIDIGATSANGLLHTHVSDQDGNDYTLASAPANGADLDDGLISVVGANHAPVASNDSYSITERTTAADPKLAVTAAG